MHRHFKQAEIKRRSTIKDGTVFSAKRNSAKRNSYVAGNAEEENDSSESDDDPDVSTMKRAINIFDRGGGARKTVLRAASKFKASLNKNAKDFHDKRGQRPSYVAGVRPSKIEPTIADQYIPVTSQPGVRNAEENV